MNGPSRDCGVLLTVVDSAFLVNYRSQDVLDTDVDALLTTVRLNEVDLEFYTQIDNP